jgi:hypothetical protein
VSEFKVGGKVWVLCEVATVYNYQSLYIDIRHDGAVFEAKRSDCRPVEPDHDDHPVEFKVGDRVVSWSGRQGVVEAINEIEGFPITVRHSMREQVSYKLGGVKHDHRPVEPANCPDLSAMGVEVVSGLGSQGVKPPTKEPTPAQKLAERTMKAIWAANHAVNGTPVVEANTKTANDQLRQSLMDYPFGEPTNCPEIPDSSSDPINPSHYKQGGIECIEAMKVALGGGFSGYLRGNTIKYLWRYDKKNGVEDLKKARWYLDRLIKEVGE